MGYLLTPRVLTQKFLTCLEYDEKEICYNGFLEVL